MAVLGVQLVVTLFTATLMHRLAPHCSFARWLLCSGSLFRYKHPSEEELRALAGRQRPRGRRERWAHGLDDEKPLSVPRDAPFQLQTCPLTAVDALVPVVRGLRRVLGRRVRLHGALLLRAGPGQGGQHRPLLVPAHRGLLHQDVPDGDPAVLQRRGGWGALGLPRLRLPVPHAGHAGAGGAGGDPGAGPGARPGQHDPELGATSAGPRLGLGTARGQAGHPRGAGGRGFRAGRLPHLPRAAAGSDPQGRAHHVGAPAAAAVAAAHQLPVPRDHLVALDPAHRAGLPAAGAPRRGVCLPAVGRGLRLGAPVGAGGALPAAPGRHAAPPAGLPVPGQSPRGAAAQGGRPHRGPRDPAAGGPRVLLRDGGEPAVPDAAHPHAQLHAAAQVLRWLLLGPGPRPSAVPGPARPQRRAARPGGRRGPGDGGAHRGRPGRAALAAPPPRAPGLPHLVDGGLPAAVQPLRPLLPPAPGRLLAACSPAARPSALARLGACPRLQHRAGACAVHRSA